MTGVTSQDSVTALTDDEIKHFAFDRAEILNQLSEGVIVAGADGRLLFVNQAAERIHGVKTLDVAPDDYSATYHLLTTDGEPYPFEHLPLARAVRGGETVEDAHWRIRRPDGSEVLAIGSARPLLKDGAQIGAILTLRDDSARFAAEQRLRESETRFRNMADNAPVMMWVTAPDGYCTYLNQRWYEFTGQSPGEAEGFGWLEAVHPADREESGAVFVAANRDHVEFRHEYRLRRADGAYRWAIDAASPRFGPDGEYLGYVGSVLDIDERREFEEALRVKGEEFYTLADNIPALAWMAYADGNIFWYNRRWYDYTGTSAETQEGWGWESVHDPAVLPLVVERWSRSLASGEPFEMTFPLRRADGLFRPFLTRVVPVRDEHGKILRWFGTNIDVSEQVAAEEALKRLNETLELRVSEEVERRTQAEDALRQAQKMETIGQLTGGIAHDFNNLLQIIAGNLDILRRTLPAESARLQRSIENAMKGTDRAAVLTQRLLAFARRQPLTPKVLDPNKLVSGMSEMVHRTLGETYAVETVLASGLWRVEADPNQLETALLNLAVNSRDAMPGGGKLTVETANTHLDRDYAERHAGVAPGQYVVICVSDTGSGMDPATAERAVEPFFTTKDVGKGTGLGLSMVYGFVKQSGGHLKIYSEPGQGTTVKIYLPRHHGAETAEAEPARAAAPAGDRSETILLCEDDDDVRAFSAESLRELGYEVLEAGDGEAALALLGPEQAPVHLLFTDVVLPGITGAVLADRARQLRPRLKVLFTTGYARNAIVHHGRLDPGVELLSKPFTYAELAKRIRDLLDAPEK
ncbi:PAS domain S-box protein [Sphingomonas sp.]|uniref:PAS domain-containing hybrid sensor histidine kinase/response regulator n=1 Tax=Sphingomonas sp. TaxID=28214 RepID=UPI00286DA24A|nr:PAS domain S-box protein [Sphingomonas sp.]